MAALIPTELLVVLVIALIIRSLNRASPFWQSLVSRLHYWPPPAERDIAIFVKAAAANAREYAATGALVRHAGELAGDLVDCRSRPVPPSAGIISDAFGWADVLLDGTANMLVMTGVYSAVAALLGGMHVRAFYIPQRAFIFPVPSRIGAMRLLRTPFPCSTL